MSWCLLMIVSSLETLGCLDGWKSRAITKVKLCLDLTHHVLYLSLLSHTSPFVLPHRSHDKLLHVSYSCPSYRIKLYFAINGIFNHDIVSEYCPL